MIALLRDILAELRGLREDLREAKRPERATRSATEPLRVADTDRAEARRLLRRGGRFVVNGD